MEVLWNYYYSCGCFEVAVYMLWLDQSVLCYISWV